MARTLTALLVTLVCFAVSRATQTDSTPATIRDKSAMKSEVDALQPVLSFPIAWFYNVSDHVEESGSRGPAPLSTAVGRYRRGVDWNRWGRVGAVCLTAAAGAYSGAQIGALGGPVGALAGGSHRGPRITSSRLIGGIIGGVGGIISGNEAYNVVSNLRKRREALPHRPIPNEIACGLLRQVTQNISL